MYRHDLNLKMLPILKETLRTIDSQPETTPAVLDIRRLLAQRLERVEEQVRTYQWGASAYLERRRADFSLVFHHERTW